MTTTKAANEITVQVEQTPVQVFTGGSGPALLFLHGAGGNPGWTPYLQKLAETRTVYAPSHPGFNGTPRPSWVFTITDVAHFTLELVEALKLKEYVLMGSSMGGWMAAEIAAMCPPGLKALGLIDAVGIKPEQGEIAEIFMVSAPTRLKQRFYDPAQVPNYEQLTQPPTPEQQQVDYSNREMASRLCWRPYMNNPSLPHYLRKVKVPTLIVWGKQDAIAPVECAHLYQRAIPHAKLAIIDHCGHSPAVEKPQEFHQAVTEFLASVK